MNYDEQQTFYTENIEIVGARENNLKNISLIIPRNELVVITGLSGSGKSSLAFDTIYAEGQRRYIESFSAYARQFIGNLERPDVDRITGLSPVISIEQKSTNRNPRSTVGTVTEIYDFMRLLFARIADAYSVNTGEKMIKYSEQKILELIFERYSGCKVVILAPLVKGRKGNYRELFEHYRKIGFTKVRIDGKIQELSFGLSLDRYKIHDIELVVDRIEVSEVSRQRVADSVQQAMRYGKGVVQILDFEKENISYYSRNLMCPTTGISYPDPEPNTFSFNSPYGACPECNGLGTITVVAMEKIVPNPKLSIRTGAIAPIGGYRQTWIFKQLEAIGDKYGFTLDTAFEEIPDEAVKIIFYGSDEVFFIRHDTLGVNFNIPTSFEGILRFIEGSGSDEISTSLRRWAEEYTEKAVCPLCGGARLKKESLSFKIDNYNIAELANLEIDKLKAWFDEVENKLEPRKQQIAKEIFKEIRSRIGFLLDVGLDYLSLNRPTASLSGGESQRIRLATQIGSQLTNVLYILDEPSIGLHQRDNHKLIKALKELKNIGNSVIVVEHDHDMMLAADHIVDLGPFAGEHGGEVVAQGSPEEIKQFNTLTADYLSGRKKIEVPQQRRKGNGKKLIIEGATGNNLKNITVEFPLGKMICVTGVSGSGKSTLINETLYPILSQHFYRSLTKPLPYKAIKGIEHIDKVIEIDQSPIGKTPRSNPATYTKVFDEIRQLFSMLPEARIRGYKPGRFSFNVKGGRCETCQGAGLKIISMNFLPDVQVLCETCHGKRYNRETLEVRYKGKNISDVLEMTVEQAVSFFENHPSIVQKIRTIKEVGLGYIKLGQQSTTLSGGEAQRVKLASELYKRDTGKTLYILDEPTTGLHFEDIRVLLDVLNRLADKGNTIIIIEHNLDVIKVCDHIIDLGPEGGEGGGTIVCEGSPEEIVRMGKGYTAEFLKKVLS